jgi:hypothetical protein
MLAVMLSPVFAQTPPASPYLKEEVRHLIGIQNRMRMSLEELPNYTCRMEIRRAHLGVKARDEIAKQIEKLRAQELARTLTAPQGETVELSNIDVPLDAADSVALEVAIIGRKELYAFPDSSRFEDRSLASMIGHGTVATGSFAGHARNIFANGAALTKYVGEELLDGEPVRRYDYVVELFRSGYSVSNQGQSATVPYFGSFWAAADNDELRRLTVRADEIPVHVGVDEFATQIDYQTLQLNSQPFIVPQRSRLTMLLSTGAESVNETEYPDCRSFSGSSTLSFDESTSQFYVEKAEAILEVDIPAGLRLPVRLTSVIDSETARVGTLVEAELTSDVRISEDSVAPQGATLSGRIRQFEFYKGGDAHYVVGVEFQELVFDGGRKRADVSLALEQIANRMGVQLVPQGPVTNTKVSKGIGNLPTVTRTTIETYKGRRLPGVGIFYVQGRQFQLKPGLQMVWRSVEAATSAEER